MGVTKAVSERFGKGGIADRMIWFNGFPFLDNKEDHSFGVSVSQVMTTQVITLPATGASLKYLEHILKDSSVQGFPIVETAESRILVGYIGSTELRYAVERAQRDTFLPPHTLCSFVPPDQAVDRDAGTRATSRATSPDPAISTPNVADQSEQPTLDLSRFINTTPLCVHPRLPLETVMELFKKLGPRSILVEYQGALTGLVTVKDCLKYQFTAEAAENMANVHRDESGHEERLWSLIKRAALYVRWKVGVWTGGRVLLREPGDDSSAVRIWGRGHQPTGSQDTLGRGGGASQLPTPRRSLEMDRLGSAGPSIGVDGRLSPGAR